MKSEKEIRCNYDELLDLYGHLSKSNYLKKKLLGKIEAYEEILDIKKGA